MTIKQFITKHEGRTAMPYICPAGKRTIGIGWNYSDNPLPEDIADYLRNNGKILDEHIDRLYSIAAQRAVSACEKLFPDFYGFTPNRRMALIDFLYNVGLGTASTFKRTLICINAGGWDDAARHLRNSLWFKQVGDRGKEVAQLIQEG